MASLTQVKRLLDAPYLGDLPSHVFSLEEWEILVIKVKDNIVHTIHSVLEFIQESPTQPLPQSTLHLLEKNLGDFLSLHSTTLEVYGSSLFQVLQSLSRLLCDGSDDGKFHRLLQIPLGVFSKYEILLKLAKGWTDADRSYVVSADQVTRLWHFSMYIQTTPGATVGPKAKSLVHTISKITKHSLRFCGEQEIFARDLFLHAKTYCDPSLLISPEHTGTALSVLGSVHLLLSFCKKEVVKSVLGSEDVFRFFNNRKSHNILTNPPWIDKPCLQLYLVPAFAKLDAEAFVELVPMECVEELLSCMWRLMDPPVSVTSERGLKPEFDFRPTSNVGSVMTSVKVVRKFASLVVNAADVSTPSSHNQSLNNFLHKFSLVWGRLLFQCISNASVQLGDFCFLGGIFVSELSKQIVRKSHTGKNFASLKNFASQLSRSLADACKSILFGAVNPLSLFSGKSKLSVQAFGAWTHCSRVTRNIGAVNDMLHMAEQSLQNPDRVAQHGVVLLVGVLPLCRWLSGADCFEESSLLAFHQFLRFLLLEYIPSSVSASNLIHTLVVLVWLNAFWTETNHGWTLRENLVEGLESRLPPSWFRSMLPDFAQNIFSSFLELTKSLGKPKGVTFSLLSNEGMELAIRHLVVEFWRWVVMNVDHAVIEYRLVPMVKDFVEENLSRLDEDGGLSLLGLLVAETCRSSQGGGMMKWVCDLSSKSHYSESVRARVVYLLGQCCRYAGGEAILRAEHQLIDIVVGSVRQFGKRGTKTVQRILEGLVGVYVVECGERGAVVWNDGISTRQIELAVKIIRACRVESRSSNILSLRLMRAVLYGTRDMVVSDATSSLVAVREDIFTELVQMKRDPNHPKETAMWIKAVLAVFRVVKRRNIDVSSIVATFLGKEGILLGEHELADSDSAILDESWFRYVTKRLPNCLDNYRSVKGEGLDDGVSVDGLDDGVCTSGSSQQKIITDLLLNLALTFPFESVQLKAARAVAVISQGDSRLLLPLILRKGSHALSDPATSALIVHPLLGITALLKLVADKNAFRIILRENPEMLSLFGESLINIPVSDSTTGLKLSIIDAIVEGYLDTVRLAEPITADHTHNQLIRLHSWFEKFSSDHWTTQVAKLVFGYVKGSSADSSLLESLGEALAKNQPRGLNKSVEKMLCFWIMSIVISRRDVAPLIDNTVLMCCYKYLCRSGRFNDPGKDFAESIVQRLVEKEKERIVSCKFSDCFTTLIRTISNKGLDLFNLLFWSSGCEFAKKVLGNGQQGIDDLNDDDVVCTRLEMSVAVFIADDHPYDAEFITSSISQNDGHLMPTIATAVRVVAENNGARIDTLCDSLIGEISKDPYRFLFTLNASVFSNLALVTKLKDSTVRSMLLAINDINLNIANRDLVASVMTSLLLITPSIVGEAKMKLLQNPIDQENSLALSDIHVASIKIATKFMQLSQSIPFWCQATSLFRLALRLINDSKDDIQNEGKKFIRIFGTIASVNLVRSILHDHENVQDYKEILSLASLATSRHIRSVFDDSKDQENCLTRVRAIVNLYDAVTATQVPNIIEARMNSLTDALLYCHEEDLDKEVPNLKLTELIALVKLSCFSFEPHGFGTAAAIRLNHFILSNTKQIDAATKHMIDSQVTTLINTVTRRGLHEIHSTRFDAKVISQLRLGTKKQSYIS